MLTTGISSLAKHAAEMEVGQHVRQHSLTQQAEADAGSALPHTTTMDFRLESIS